MIRDKQIAEETSQLQVLNTVTNAYAQLSSLWMNRARTSVLKSRDYLEELHQVFLTVFSSYVREVQALARRRNLMRGDKITFLAHNGKKVGVLLSANTGFYGNIIQKTFELFMKDLKTTDMEVTIVGRQGRALFQSEEPDRPHTYFEISDERIDQHQLIDLVRHLVQYQEIRVYYGRFQSFLNQDPVVFTISADPYADLQPEEKTKSYLFEPDLEHLLMFFEKQMFTSVFEQTVRESQLAKYASRVMVMDRAGENIRRRLKNIDEKWLRISHRIANQKQSARYSGMKLWS